MDGFATKLERAIPYQRAWQKPGFTEDLETVADSQHQTAVVGEAADRLHHRTEPGDGSAAEVVAIAETARHQHGVGVAQGFLLVPDIIRLVAKDTSSSFEKLGTRAYLVISVAMVACLLWRDRKRRIAEARIAVGAASPVARRLHGLEEDLVGQDPETPTIQVAHLEPLAPVDDTRGSAEYRLAAIKELCKRAIGGAARVI